MDDSEDLEWMEMQSATLMHRSLVCATEAQIAKTDGNEIVEKYLLDRAAHLKEESLRCRRHADALRSFHATEEDALPF